MAILIDTNVLLRSVQPSHPMHAAAVRALETLLKQDEEPLVVAQQNVAEFWNVATRPAASNGLGFTIEEATAELTTIESLFPVLNETPESYAIWKELVIANRVSGVQVHDARLVAVMRAHDVRRILTFNVPDFARFVGLETLHPSSLSH